MVRQAHHPEQSRRGILKTFVCPGFPAAGGLRDFRNDVISARDERIATCTTMLAKGIPKAICGPGPLFSATSFNDPLDSGLPDSYLSWSKEKQVDTLYPPEYLLVANMDKKYPLECSKSR
ncbi:MAG: hypothetical protein WBF55_02725 [Syntrophobacteria bacterium]|nr:MAG: hypothetical protein C0610_00880 [Desulfobacteraceae bacterium]